VANIGPFVKIEKIVQLLSSANVHLEDPAFLSKVFTLMVKRRKRLWGREGRRFERISIEEYDDLSKRIDRTNLQDSSAVRNVLRTRSLANILIDDQGDLDLNLLTQVIDYLSNQSYSLGPNRQYDVKRQDQILKALTLLKKAPELQRALKKVGKPSSHKIAEQMIRDTLQLPSNIGISDVHARRAALSAWLCYLRQSVGSCFATAPAIIVHDEQPLQFFNDIIELLGTGRLKRTFGGVEYAVPLSASWGVGDLRRMFVVEMGPPLEKMDLWSSPGLLVALEATNFIDPSLALKQKIEISKNLVQKALDKHFEKQEIFLLSVENLIRFILLDHLNLTEHDLQDYENRPRGMIQSSLLLQVPKAAFGSGGKGEACARFYLMLEHASNAFKGLADNALLKVWEFSLASFAETKATFTRWNLYSSLGLRPEDKGGIGNVMFEIIKTKLERINEQVHQHQGEYEQVYSHVKYLEGRMRQASTEKEAQWIKVEYQSKVNELHLMEELRDKAHDKAKQMANLFDQLIEIYDKLFPQYFQEVYDADMHEVQVGPYDDSPAGFRLLYKHGRSNTSQWTSIKSPNEFIEVLVSFFTATESGISSSEELEGVQTDISEIITAVVNHIRTQEFLETAFYRIAAAYNTPIVKDPLENLDKIEKKPWAYTSGGTMGTLVSCYFRREQMPTEVGRWVENPTELLVFLVDTVKQLPVKTKEEFLQNPKKSLLIHSPTHAFLLKPGVSPFKEAWNNEAYTYIWLRDNLIKPMETFNENLLFTEEMIEFLIQTFAEKVPENFRYYFKKSFGSIHQKMYPRELRFHLLDNIDHQRGLQYAGRGVLSSEDIDSMFFSLLPLCPRHQIQERVLQIIAKLPGLNDEVRERINTLLQELTVSVGFQQYVGANTLQDITRGLISLAAETTTTSIDYHWHVSAVAKALGFAIPTPVIFADTNWVKDEFGFVVNPGTGKLSLWRVDYTGSVGVPMTSWEQWLNGSRQDRTWGIYTRPYEYST